MTAGNRFTKYTKGLTGMDRLEFYKKKCVGKKFHTRTVREVAIAGRNEVYILLDCEKCGRKMWQRWPQFITRFKLHPYMVECSCKNTKWVGVKKKGRSKFAVAYREYPALRQLYTLEEFIDEQYEAWKEADKKYGRGVHLLDSNPKTKADVKWGRVYSRNCRLIDVDGDVRLQGDWGLFLGVTRERARQLRNEGTLVARVRAMKNGVDLKNVHPKRKYVVTNRPSER